MLIGHAGHEEVVGTMGEAPESTVLVGSVAEAEALELPPGTKVAYTTQTTLSVDETAEIIAALRRRFPEIRAPRREDICYATSNRQWAVKELLEHVGVLLVIGSRNSSNSNRLVEVARAERRSGLPHRRRVRHRPRVARRRRDGRCHLRRVGPRAPRRARVRLVPSAGHRRIEPFRLADEDVRSGSRSSSAASLPCLRRR